MLCGQKQITTTNTAATALPTAMPIMAPVDRPPQEFGTAIVAVRAVLVALTEGAAARIAM